LPAVKAQLCTLRACRFLFWVLLFLLAGPVLGQNGHPAESRLLFTNWRATAYSHRAGGTVCWLEGEDGSLRMEVRQGRAGFEPGLAPDRGIFPADVIPLLTREGEGWTLVLGPDDTGTLNSWGQEWRKPPTGLARLVRLVTTVMVQYPHGVPATEAVTQFPVKQDPGLIPRPVFRAETVPAAGSGETWRYQMASLDPEVDQPSSTDSFRTRMSARGRGTGGSREVVSLTWTGNAAKTGFGVRVRSSRRPGTLELDPLDSQVVATPVPEFFLPLWPMARFF